MTSGDLIGLVSSYIYAFGILLFIEAIGRRLGWHQRFTRKIIHIAAGMWIWGVLYFFDHWYLGIIPFASFIILNFIFYCRKTFSSMDATDSSPGTIYFAVSTTILFGLLWRTSSEQDSLPIAAAAVMAMTWGDAFASMVGQRWGRRHYRVFEHQRSIEGSIAMFAASFSAIFLTLYWLPGSALSPGSEPIELPLVFLMSLVGAVVVTVVEAISPVGVDNLSVPLLCALCLYIMQVFSWRLMSDPSQLVLQLIVGAALSVTIGVLAFMKNWLSPSGVAGAVLVGTLVFGCGGWVWGGVLITFFVLSSLLSHYRKMTKKAQAVVFSKNGRRDFAQTLANGGVGALLALATVWWKHPALLAGFIGAIATVNADTWATEIGILSSRRPRLITTWRRVPRGTSGGISVIGTIATVAGAMTIGLALLLFLSIEAFFKGPGSSTGAESVLWVLPAAVLGGVAGSLFDSVLGATVQSTYYSASLGKETELSLDSDGTPNRLVRGWRCLGNDGVNFSSSIVGAVVAVVVLSVIK